MRRWLAFEPSNPAPRTGTSPQLCESAFIKTITTTTDSRQLGRTLGVNGESSTHSTDSLSYDSGKPFHRFRRLFALDPPVFLLGSRFIFARAASLPDVVLPAAKRLSGRCGSRRSGWPSRNRRWSTEIRRGLLFRRQASGLKGGQHSTLAVHVQSVKLSCLCRLEMASNSCTRRATRARSVRHSASAIP